MEFIRNCLGFGTGDVRDKGNGRLVRVPRLEQLESRQMFAVEIGVGKVLVERPYFPDFHYVESTQQLIVTARAYGDVGLRAEFRDDGAGPRVDLWYPEKPSSSLIGKALPAGYVPRRHESFELLHRWVANGRPVASIKFVGSEGRDLLINDTAIPVEARGNGGNDLLVGGRGADRLHGNAGIDVLQGGDGDDFLYGGSDGDIIRGQSGNDLLHGDGGDDELFGGEGDDVLLGNDGGDKLFGDDDENALEILRRTFGISGSLVVTRTQAVANSFHDFLDGGSGDDFLDGQFGHDIVAGGAGNDVVRGGEGNDFVFGDVSPLDFTTNTIRSRTIMSYAYSDVFIDFAKDILDVETDADVRRIDPLGIRRERLGPVGYAVDLFHELEMLDKWAHRGDFRFLDQLFGGAGNDLLVGSNARDQLFGSSGDDALFGGGGDDWLDPGLPSLGELGAVVAGGDGFDTLVNAYQNDVMASGRLQREGITFGFFRPVRRPDGMVVLPKIGMESEVMVSVSELLRLGQL